MNFSKIIFAIFATLTSVFSMFVSATENSNEITIAVAANFSPTLEKIIKAFKEENKINSDLKIQVVSSASGSIFRQIIQGAPYDLFLSADNILIDKLVQENIVLANEHFPYARGILVLCARNEKRNKSLTAGKIKQLLEKTSAKIALADPKSAPYGKAAEQFLKNSYTLNKIKEKLIFTRDVGQVINYLDTGVVDFGFVPRSLTEKSKTCLPSNIWTIPTENYEPIIQVAGLLKHGKTNHLAKRFFNFLRTKNVKVIIENSFYLPGSNAL